MKFTDKALLRKLVEIEGVFLRFDVDVLSFFQVTVFLLLLLSIMLGVSRGNPSYVVCNLITMLFLLLD